MQNYELGGVLHSPFMQTQIPKRCKKGRFEEPGPNSFLKHHNLKRKAKREGKMLLLSLCAHVVCCGQDRLKRKYFNSAAIHERFPHTHTCRPLKNAHLVGFKK